MPTFNINEQCNIKQSYINPVFYYINNEQKVNFERYNLQLHKSTKIWE